jgi:hypothetical protein
MVELSPNAVISMSSIAELLAPTLGCEKSAEVVEGAALRLGFSPEALRADQALAMLDELARTPGMVGIAARFARSRLDAQRASLPPAAEPPSRRYPGQRSTMGETPKPPPQASTLSPPGTGPVSSRSVVTTISTRDVAALLSSAMGMDKALEIVTTTSDRLGLSPDHLDKTQAIALLDQLAGEPGMVGLCARFGKARLILRFAA